MSFNQPPPNPYGQQPPQQPGPPPGYGYPQQGGVPSQPNPYTQPQPPQGPNPYAQQAGWGGPLVPPPPAPPKTNNVTKIVAIAAAAVVVVGGGLWFALGGSGSAGADYKLSTPDAVMGGKYTKDPSMSSKISSQTGSETGSDHGISNATSVSQAWKSGSDELLLAGAYGNVSDASAAAGTLLSAVGVSSTTDEHPSGFDGSVLKCGTHDMGLGSNAPMCVWGDGSTVALVMWAPYVDPNNLDPSNPTPPSVSDWAQTTVQLRSEVRVKK